MFYAVVLYGMQQFVPRFSIRLVSIQRSLDSGGLSHAALVLLNFLSERTMICRSAAKAGQLAHLLFNTFTQSSWYLFSSSWLWMYSQSPAAPAATDVLVRKYSLCCSLSLCRTHLKAQTCPGSLLFFPFHPCRPATVHAAKVVPASSKQYIIFLPYLVHILSSLHTEEPEIAAFKLWLLVL